MALLSHADSLRQLLAGGKRPALIGTWSEKVADLARATGIPTLVEDELLALPERQAIQRHSDALAAALAGPSVPTGRDYADWAWWALEFPARYVTSQGARTRHLLDAMCAAPGASAKLVYDVEGLLQGGVLVGAARERQLVTIAFQPHFNQGDATARRHDFPLVPLVREDVRVDWRGAALPSRGGPNVALVHTNEVAHLMQPLLDGADPWFRLVQDARQPWPARFRGPAADAAAGGRIDQLVDGALPAEAAALAQPWERELLELLYVTWQPFLREEHLWARAAYEAGRVRLFVGGSDHFPAMRCRLLACRDLGIPFALVQHGAFTGTRVGHPNHRLADHHLVWSRAAARELDAAGAAGERHVIGWPQASFHRRRGVRWVPAERETWVVLTAGTNAPWHAEASQLRGRRFLEEAMHALRAARPRAAVLIKCHPFIDNPDELRRWCDAEGFADVEIRTGIDPWDAIRTAHGVVTWLSTAAYTAASLGVPTIMHALDAGPLPDLGRASCVVTRTRAELDAALAAPPASRRDAGYARDDVDAGRRALATLRRLVLGPRAARPAIARPANRAARRAAQRRARSAT